MWHQHQHAERQQKKETPPPTPPGKAIRCCPNEWAQFKLFKVFTKQTSLEEARWVPGSRCNWLLAGWRRDAQRRWWRRNGSNVWRRSFKSWQMPHMVGAQVVSRYFWVSLESYVMGIWFFKYFFLHFFHVKCSQNIINVCNWYICLIYITFHSYWNLIFHLKRDC